MNILFSGCSVVQGVGLPDMASDAGNFANLVGHALNGRVTNIAHRGNSNERIFLDTAVELASNTYDLIIVCWTSYPRQVIWPGLELYECRRSLTPGSATMPEVEHNGNDRSWSSAQFEKMREWFILMIHDHYSILDICRYIKVLRAMVSGHKAHIYFVNTMTHWDTGYFEQFERLDHESVRPDMLTAYTNKILNSDNRDDEQINALFHKIKNDYHQAGGIQPQHWLNLYESLVSMKIDNGNDPNKHPGPLSHKRYAEFLTKNIKLKHIIN